MRYSRPPGLVAIGRGSSYLFVLADRPEPILLDDVDTEAFGRLLAHCVTPTERDALLEHCDQSALDLLVELGVLVAEREGAAKLVVTRPPAKRCKTVVVGLSASIGVAGALEHVIGLADGFAETVEVVVSARAENFIQPRVFEYYGLRTWSDPYSPAHGVAVPHSHLAAVADVMLVAPASASMLHKIASGACSDLISLIVANTRAPVVIAPSMNEQMWLHPPIQRNVTQLRADGFWIIEPGPGFRVGARDDVNVGGLGFDLAGLARALDVILASAK